MKSTTRPNFRFAVFVLLVLFTSLNSHGGNKSRIPLEISKTSEQEFVAKLKEFEEKIPEILEFREHSLDIYGRLTEKLESKDASLSRLDSEALYSITVERKKIRAFLKGLVNKYKYSVTKYHLSDYEFRAQSWTFRQTYLVASAIF